MEKKYFYKNRKSKLFIWLATITLTLFILNRLFSNGDKGLTNSLYLVFLSLAFVMQYYLYKRWYIKIDNDTIFIRKNNLFTTKEIPFTDIVQQKVLVTGDLELKLQNEKMEILKDHLEEVDFREIQDKIIKITQ